MSRSLRRARHKLRTLGALSTFFISTGRWWLLPMVGVLLLGGMLIGVVQVVEYAAPFVYTIF
ncbi:MAG: DUF5989 family protein [Myxococcota bacterium]